MTELRVKPPGRPARGRIKVPGDKSISHRAVMLSAVANGSTRVRGLLFSEDVLATVGAFVEMGLTIETDEAGDEILIRGRGHRALHPARRALDLGNSGTSLRLLTGLLAGLPVEALLVGDASLMRRPMKRVLEPLRLMGADVSGTKNGTAPIMVKGGRLKGIEYELPVASAQLKSAILLAGLFAKGETWVREPGPSRDHTELMLPAFGVKVKKDGPWVGLKSVKGLDSPGEIEVPGDISSAAFFIAAALTVPGSELTIEKVGVNPTRAGLIEILRSMGAQLELTNHAFAGAEPVADLIVRHGPLRAGAIQGDLIVRAIDEIPALCVIATAAAGRTEIRDAGELRVKESDRISAMVKLLTLMGAKVGEREDGLWIEGPVQLRGAAIDCGLDHRVAMAAAVAGLSAQGETVISGADTIASSFPGFNSLLTDISR